MRIALDASCMPPQIAGAGRYICGLLSGLSKVDSRNEYFVFTKQRSAHLFDDLGSNFTVVILPNYDRPRRIAWQLFAPENLVQRHQLDVWHAPHYLLPRGLADVKTVVTCHDMTFFLFPEFYSPSRKWFFKRAICDAIKRADKIVAVSKTTMRDIKTLFGPLPDRLQHVYSGTNGEFRPHSNETNDGGSKSKITTGDPFVLFVGTLERRKNVPSLIQAFSKLPQKDFPNLKLVLVGQKENGYQQICQTVNALEVRDRIVLAGYLPEEELATLYAAAALFAYPSFYEGFGFPVLEAMASGTPVLTSNTSAMQEIAQIEEIQVSPHDPSVLSQRMEHILCDATFRERVVSFGLKRAEELTWENTAKQMVELYEGVNRSPRRFYFMQRQQPSTAETGTGDMELSFVNGGVEENTVAEAILKTVVYSDLFSYPLKIEELHRNLIACEASLGQVQRELRGRPVEGFIEMQDGYLFLTGREETVENRTDCETISERILTRNRRLLNFVSYFPFVRGAALSGAVAFKNCTAGDDIDLFLIVDARRLWTVYLLLACFLTLLGKRNLICLNYLFGRADLKIDSENYFVAHQIANLRPISGNGLFRDFLKANGWVLEYLPQATISPFINQDSLMPTRDPATPRSAPFLRSLVEKFVGLRVFDVIERCIYKFYGQHIRNITAHLNGSVSVERDQIRLFTNDHRAKVLKNFQNRLNQLQELEHES